MKREKEELLRAEERRMEEEAKKAGNGMLKGWGGNKKQ